MDNIVIIVITIIYIFNDNNINYIVINVIIILINDITVASININVNNNININNYIIIVNIDNVNVIDVENMYANVYASEKKTLRTLHSLGLSYFISSFSYHIYSEQFLNSHYFVQNILAGRSQQQKISHRYFSQ